MYLVLGLILLGLAVAIVEMKDLVLAIILLGVFSLLLALYIFILQAPDVALAEAALGAGASTAFFLAAIKRTKRWE